MTEIQELSRELFHRLAQTHVAQLANIALLLMFRDVVQKSDENFENGGAVTVGDVSLKHQAEAGQQVGSQLVVDGLVQMVGDGCQDGLGPPDDRLLSQARDEGGQVFGETHLNRVLGGHLQFVEKHLGQSIPPGRLSVRLLDLVQGLLFQQHV